MTKVKILALIVLMFFSATDLFAETVNIYNVPFEVDALEQVDSVNSQVTINGRSKILPTKETDLYIVENLLQPGNLDKIELDKLETLFRGSAQADNLELAIAVFRAYSLHPKFPGSYRSLLEQVKNYESFNKILKALLSSIELQDGALATELYFYISIDDPEFLRAKTVLPIGRKEYEKIATDYFVENIKDLEFTPEPFVNIRKAAKILSIESLVLLSDVGLKAREFYKAGDIDQFDSLIRTVKDEPSHYVSMVEELYFKLILTVADSALTQSDSKRALSYLVKIPLERRTPTLHQLVIRAVKNLNQSELQTVLESDFAPFLKALSEKDPELASLIVQKNEGYYLPRGLLFFILAAIAALIYRFSKKQFNRPDPVQFNQNFNNNAEQDRDEKLLALLGLTPGATKDQIKTAYRKAVKEHHPDLNSDQDDNLTSDFVELTSAYQELLKR